jgi:hypothetical protein
MWQIQKLANIIGTFVTIFFRKKCDQVYKDTLTYTNPSMYGIPGVPQKTCGVRFYVR